MTLGVKGTEGIRLGAVKAAIASALAVIGLTLGLFPSLAQADPLGITGYFGNASTTQGFTGGEFASTAGAAVNDSTGEVYVADAANNRIERFDADGNFISAWGADVISGTASGTGTWASGSFDVSAVVATAGRFLPGQVITGPGIAPGTKIASVAGTGVASTLKLTKPTTAEGTNAALSVAAQPNNVATNERQVLTVTATGGTFKLTAPAAQGYAAATTAANIPFNATPEEIKTALETLQSIGTGNVVVSSSLAGVYEIVFQGARADTNMGQLTVAAGSPALSGGTATVATTIQGTAPEVCTVASECKQGVVWGTGATEVNGGGIVASPQGIAINQETGDLYVSQANFRRMEQFTAAGAFIRAWGADAVLSGPEQADEQQRLTVDATGGQYKLTFNAQTTSDIDFDAPAATVQSALESLSSIGAGNVTVSKGPGGAGGTTPYLIAFGGTLADTNLAAITVAAGTTPLVGTATIATLNDGAVGFEVCGTAANCKIGVLEKAVGFNNAMGYPAVAPAGAPNAGNVLVGDIRRAMEFTAAGAFVRAWGWNLVASGPSNTPAPEFEICRAASLDLCTAVPPGGAGLGQFAASASAPNRIAIATDGSIYAVENLANFRVQKFDPSGGSLIPTLFNPPIGAGETLTSSTPAASASNTPTDIAVDPTDNHVYVVRAVESGKGEPAANVAERRIFEFDASGTLVETHLANYALNSVNGFALKAGGEPGYLTSSTPKIGVYVIGPPVPPEAFIETTTGVTADSAVLHGAVKPNGGGPLHTSYRFEYSSDGGSTWTKAPVSAVDIGSGSEPGSSTTCPTPEAEECKVSQAISGLEPNKEYKVRLVAIKGGSPVLSTGPAGDFETDPEAPIVETFAAFWDSSSDELVLRGSVNPNNTATAYYFEYGTAPCSSNPCASVPVTQDGSAGSGAVPVPRAQRVPGLTLGATYHYRIVADNGVEVGPGVTKVEGSELTIQTPGADACENEKFRTGPSSDLPECRAYERVSDGNSWGVGSNSVAPAVADSGDRAQFVAQAFGEPVSVPGPNTPFTAVRGQDGWDVTAIFPTPDRAFGNPLGLGAMTTPDLGSMLWPEATLGERQRGEVQWSRLGLDGSRTPAIPLVVPVDHSGGNADRAQQYRLNGASTDFSTFVFSALSEVSTTSVKLLSDEPRVPEGRSNLYVVSGAGGPNPTLDVVNRADGETGPVIGGVCGAGLGGHIGANQNAGSAPTSNAVSLDGSVIYFTVRPGAPAEGGCGNSTAEAGIGGPKRLFKRVDGEATVQISESQCSPACAGPSGDDDYQGASADGSVVAFVSPRRLVNLDTDNTADLYVYDASPPAGQPTLALASAGEVAPGHPTPGSGAEALRAMDVSSDGSRVYFIAKGALAGANTAGNAPVVGQPNLYVYQRDDAHPGGRIAFVATVDSGDPARLSFALPSDAAGDGHFLVLLSAAKLLSEDGDNQRDIYRYDDESGELRCLSCMGGGAFDVNVEPAERGRSHPNAEQLAPPASADASTVVFTTNESLVSGDQNATGDAYLWKGGVLSLISGGSEGLALTGGEISRAAISADGKNVFFYTVSPLVGGDTNSAIDLYDARVGGGFAEASPPVTCIDNDECHPPEQTIPPGGGGGGSDSFVGPGNVPPPPPVTRKPCKKGQVRKKGRCVKKPARKGGAKKRAGKNRASHDRGGNR